MKLSLIIISPGKAVFPQVLLYSCAVCPTGERYKELEPEPVPSCKLLKGLVAETILGDVSPLVCHPPPSTHTHTPSLARNCGRTRVRRFPHQGFEANPISISINILVNSKKNLTRTLSDSATKLLKPQWAKT